MPAKTKVVRERIDPQLTAALFANYRTPVDAILELVDNAFDSRVPDRPLEVDLALRPGTLVLVVTGGEGMGPREIERQYLRWGGSRKRAGDAIGRYGQGGKAAIGHLGTRFEVVAGLPGEAIVYGFADEDYRDRAKLRTYELVERRKPVASELGYVRIEIGGVDKKLDARRLRARLAETYRPLLEHGAVVMRLDRSPVVPPAWDLDERTAISVRAGGRLVRGWWGLLQDPVPPSAPEAGVRLYHLGRLVGAPEWFGHPGPAQHPALNRLVGEVELPHVPVTMNKADLDRGSETWAAVEQRLYRELGPVVRRLTRSSDIAPSANALRTADQVRRILARALRLLESGKLFESEVGGPGEEPGGQLTLDAPGPSHAPETPAGEADAGEADAATDGAHRTGARPSAPRPCRAAVAPVLAAAAASARWSSAPSTRGCGARWWWRTASAGWSSTRATRSTRCAAATSGTSWRRRCARSA